MHSAAQHSTVGRLKRFLLPWCLSFPSLPLQYRDLPPDAQLAISVWQVRVGGMQHAVQGGMPAL